MQTPSDTGFWTNQMDTFPDLSQSLYPNMGPEGGETGYIVSDVFPANNGATPLSNIIYKTQIEPSTGASQSVGIEGFNPTNDFSNHPQVNYHTQVEPSTNVGYNLVNSVSEQVNPVNDFSIAPGNHYRFEGEPSSAVNQNLPVPTIPDRHYCNWQGCFSNFSRKADRDRHVQTKHRSFRHYHCRVIGCNKGLGKWKGYSRLDKLQEHMRKKHTGVIG